MPPSHTRKHYVILQAFTRLLITEVGKAEITFKFMPWIVGCLAILAIGSLAGKIAKLTYQPLNLRELMPHPGS